MRRAKFDLPYCRHLPPLCDPRFPDPKAAMIRLLALLATTVLLLASPLRADCMGENLFATMEPGRLATITAAADAQPFPRGNHWRATRGDEVITLVGTYHFDDPRHAANLQTIAPAIKAATTVLVEAGPEEEAALQARIASEPGLMMITEGPTLLERLPPDTWDRLSAALAARGVPGIMAAKLQPWYVAVMLSIPPCVMAKMVDPKGLDGLVIETALGAGVPVRALEPYDTIFTLFGAMSETEVIAMIDSTLAMEDRAEDYFATLADSYFAGDSRMIWEFMRFVSYDLPGYTREQVDAEYARMEDMLMDSRNRAWIPVLTKAAADGPVFAAFGALHLSGKAGVLNLLQDEGFTLTELPL
jgi:uncharacterized protein